MLHRICNVGAFNEEGSTQRKGLAFVPMDTGNMCCDFVLVLPTADRNRAGRVVFAVQCKHSAKDVAGKKGLHALAYFRYGRHCLEAEVFLQKKVSPHIFVYTNLTKAKRRTTQRTQRVRSG